MERKLSIFHENGSLEEKQLEIKSNDTRMQAERIKERASRQVLEKNVE